MVLMLDGLGQRYSLLPSEVMQRADTLDLYVMDSALAWQRYCEEMAEAKSKGLPSPAPKLSESEMLKMMERVKNEVHSNN